jgi:cation transport ATPase
MDSENNHNLTAITPRESSEGNQMDQVEKTITAIFPIEGMTCLSCARKIEKALIKLAGVKKARVNFGRCETVVTYNPKEVGLGQLKTAVQAAGYQLIPGRDDDWEEAGERSKKLVNLKPYLFGATAGIGVVSFYLGLLTLTSDWYNARLEFKHFGVWILALAAGLGVQVTLFSFYRTWHRGEAMKAAKRTLAASGGLSTTAMAACCSHYLVTFLPALGLPFLSAAAAGLAEYQSYFFLIGLLSNLFGIGLMLRMMDRSGMVQLKGVLNRPFSKFQQLNSRGEDLS